MMIGLRRLQMVDFDIYAESEIEQDMIKVVFACA